jgi:hypothetical protein
MFKSLKTNLLGLTTAVISLIYNRRMTAEKTQPQETFPAELLWLADSPLFVDAARVNDLTTALLGNDYDIETITNEFSSKDIHKIEAAGSGEMKVALSEVVSIFTLGLKPESKLGVQGKAAYDSESGVTQSIVKRLARSAQRQLVLLTVHYLREARNRIFFLRRPKVDSWFNRETILDSPRELLFLEFPSLIESEQEKLPSTKIIPTAAEFVNGKIVTFYDKLRKENGEKPPLYPEWKPGSSAEALREERKKYWNWFDANFSATRTMVLVEELASENGRISWIDFRVVISDEGDSLHLHVCPNGNFDTGVFAYNLIKRGFTHGIRLVGTVRSEPSMNVLAIYDK